MLNQDVQELLAPVAHETEPEADPESDLESRPAKSSGRRRLFPVFFVLVIAWTAVVWIRDLPAMHRPIEEQTPDLQLTTFEGDTIALADLRGQGVVLNFWASWCGPCRAEAPLLEAVWRKTQGQGIVFLGVNVQDTESGAETFLADYALTYANGADEGQAWARAFSVRSLPQTFFINPDGVIVAQVSGALLNADHLYRNLDRIRPVDGSTAIVDRPAR